jgi:Tfp pilus assembly protein PilF
LWSEAKTPSTRYLLPAVLAANLILPAQHVLWPFVIPIRYLYTSMDGYRDPPDALRPETYFELGKTMRKEGNRPGAEWGFEMTLRLDKNFADAYAARASMRLEQGNMVDAQSDLDTALRLKPDLSDALLLRAAFRRAQGEVAGAIEDLQHALDTAPPDWPLRGETQKFLDEIKSKTTPVPKLSP